MPSLTPAERRKRERHRDAERKRIYRVLDSLWSSQAHLDLDTIDGEFYFRCCVPGCDDRLQRLQADNFTDGLAKLTAATSLWVDFRIPLPVAKDHVFSGVPLRLRHPAPTVSVGAADERPVEQSMSARVFACDWTGEQVARMITERYQQRYRVRQEDKGTASVRIDFALVLSGAGAPGGMEAPHVKVTMPLPLPPPVVIAVAYDAIVREQHAWHEIIAQATRQDTVVAMRTWTVALLRKQGVGTVVALGEWHRMTDMPFPSRKGFQEDLDRLIKRVPEAAPHLSLRRHPSSS